MAASIRAKKGSDRECALRRRYRVLARLALEAVGQMPRICVGAPVDPLDDVVRAVEHAVEGGRSA